jgi:hypothetical protein
METPKDEPSKKDKKPKLDPAFEKSKEKVLKKRDSVLKRLSKS